MVLRPSWTICQIFLEVLGGKSSDLLFNQHLSDVFPGFPNPTLTFTAPVVSWCEAINPFHFQSSSRLLRGTRGC